MALIVITLADNAKGEVDVGVQCEPAIDTGNPNAQLTGAQQLALAMLNAGVKAGDMKQDRGLIALIN